MRTTTIMIALVLALSVIALAPGAQARAVACTDIVNPECEGIVCADTSLDGRFQPNECEPRYCTCDPPRDPW